MLHTDSDFLNAIAAQPGDRTLRLVYADWLDEQSDPQPRPADRAGSSIGAGRGADRAELVRVEEEMRELPVFADRFWELKPRRNALRTQVGAEWCGQMRYGTECEPVFRHGIPDGWRERWRLIREFTERWHRIPMPDIGGRQKEIAEAETRLGLKLPPSVREWIAFAHDTQVVTLLDGPTFWARSELEEIDNGQSLLLAPWPHHGVQIQHLNTPDPPVHVYQYYDGDHHLAGAESALSSVTDFALRAAVLAGRREGDYFMRATEMETVEQVIESFFPLVARFGGLAIHEGNNLLAAFQHSEVPQWIMWRLKVSPALDLDTLPDALRDFIQEWNRRRAAGEDDPIPF